MSKCRTFEEWRKQGYLIMNDGWFINDTAVASAVNRIAKRAYNRGKQDVKNKLKKGKNE